MKNAHQVHVEHESSQKASHPSQTLSGVGIGLLVVIILLQSVGLYLLSGYSVSLSWKDADMVGIKRALLELEYDKVGGKENYELITQATLIQMKDQIPQIKQFIKTQGWDSPSTPETPVGESITPEKLAEVLENAVIEGNKDADILVIEYSDMECPFCVKQYHDTQLKEKLLSEFAWKIGFAFKNNKWVNHEWTEAKALGALCAQKVGWDAAYVKFYTAVMDGTTQTSWVYLVSKLPDAARAAWVDQKAWQACLDQKDTQAIFASQTSEANDFGLGGTPGTLIINKKTGKYATVEWAYPYTTFTQKIQSLQ